MLFTKSEDRPAMELCRIAAHNFKTLGLAQAEIRETDSSLSPDEWPDVACCFVDPARRDTAGRKTVAIEDCEPDLSILQEAIRRKAAFSLIKLSPMLDIRTALRTLAHVAEVHAVSVQGECILKSSIRLTLRIESFLSLNFISRLLEILKLISPCFPPLGGLNT